MVGTCVCLARLTLAADAADPQITAALAQVSAARLHQSVDKLVSFGTRSTLSAQDPASIAAGHGIGAARDWLKEEFERYSRACGGCLAVQLDSFVAPTAERIPKPTPIGNVYAIMRGADPREASRIVLVTGHYDSRITDVLDAKGTAPGANDDASGTAVSLECARVLSRLHFPATIVFLAVAGEEQNLGGSEHFARMARERGWNIEAVLNNDIIGGDRNPAQDPGVVRVFSEGLPAVADERQIREIRARGAESDSPSRELARYVEEGAALYQAGVRPLLVFRLDRYLRAGDHASFNAQGYAAVRFTELREGYDHQHQNVRTEAGHEYGDLAKFVDFDYVARVARLNAAILAELAAAPAPPANVELLTATLSHESALRWSAVPRAARYEVLWRATTSPRWEHVQDVGAHTSATLDVSKDEMIFAVRAIDAAGHRSLPVVPQPVR